MFLVDWVILLTGAMVLLGIASSKLSTRLGLPVLVLFLGLGMLAGSEGVGGIEFENYSLAHAIGTWALALILFDGGLGTPLAAVMQVWKPAIALAFPGVLLTAVTTGLAASWILQVPLLDGLLLGSIVSSTDAAAVFAILRAGGVSLTSRLQSMLELESGSNDPMAIFLTIGCLEVLTGQTEFGVGLLSLFASQMVIGALVGLAGGAVSVRLVNWMAFDAAGLYPTLVTGCALLIFGIAVAFGGSGFLAVYLAGIVLGNRRLVFQRGIRIFHDAFAWLSQIVMFVVLGLLSFPSRLVDVAPQGLLVGAVLFLLARPVAVVLLLLPFRFAFKEVLFISWVGLKGAVPITLATFPLLYGVEHAGVIFDVVFCVVVLSALVQGWSLPWVARRLGLERPPQNTPPVTLEISSLRHVDGDIVDYTVGTNSNAADRQVKDLALPDGVVLALVIRAGDIIPPQGPTRLRAGDHVVVILRPGRRALVDRIFAASPSTAPLPSRVEFPLRASTTVGAMEDMYGISFDCSRDCSLDDLMHRKLDRSPAVDDVCSIAPGVDLRVRRLRADGRIDEVGMSLWPPDDA